MKKIFSILLACVLISSCVDTHILPENKTLDEDFWQKKDEVQSVLGKAYVELRNEELMRSFIVWGDFRSDELQLSSELKVTNTITTDLQSIYAGIVTQKNVFSKWNRLYLIINYCNLVIERAAEVMTHDPDYTPGDCDADIAQAKALRAYCYFTLVKVFRDVPVTPHAYMNSSDNMLEEQKTPAEVLNLCINDLESVWTVAPESNAYRSSSDNKGFFNKDGIDALLAEIYLWRASLYHHTGAKDDYNKCIEHCNRVIASKKGKHIESGFGQSSTYLVEDYYLTKASDMYTQIFGQQNSEESILEIQFHDNIKANTGLMQMYVGYGSLSSGYGYCKATPLYGTYNAAPSADNLFKNLIDQRLFEFFGKEKSDEKLDEYPIRKFAAEKSTDPLKLTKVEKRSTYYQNWIIYRLTDVMLMKAEALVQMGEGKAAFDIVKIVNDRAIDNNANGLKYSLYQDKMEELVLAERARELCFEGKRWYDLMRYNFRHTVPADPSKLLYQIDASQIPAISAEFADLAFSKYQNKREMQEKLKNECYLYMPVYEDEMDLNPNIHQNPVFYEAKKSK